MKQQHTCPECGGWRGRHFTNCPETPELPEIDVCDVEAEPADVVENPAKQANSTCTSA